MPSRRQGYEDAAELDVAAINEANKDDALEQCQKAKKNGVQGRDCVDKSPGHENERGQLKAKGKKQEQPVDGAKVSLLKAPRVLTKQLPSPEVKPGTKHGEKKSNIPIFRRSSKEFEDIRSPQESPKRSLIPQR